MAILDKVEPLSTSFDRDGDTTTLAITGELDLSAFDQFSALMVQARDGASRLRLDFDGCTFIDSSGIQAVFDTARRCRDDGCELSVANLQDDVARVFQLSGLLDDGSPVHHESP